MAEESTTKLFSEKIRELKGTQEGIETLSHWVQFHRKKIGSIVRVWVKELAREGVQYAKRKLLLLYVANDVMQASRKKNKQIVDEFAKALPSAVKHFCRHCDAKGGSARTAGLEGHPQHACGVCIFVRLCQSAEL